MARTVYAAREGQKFAGDANLTTVECSTCHMTYAIPNGLYRSALKYRGDQSNGWRLFCPLGHEWWYVGETEEERLRRHLGHARDETARQRALRDQAEAQARAQKAAKTRIKNDRDRLKRYVGAGTCPVPGCRRHFQNLQRHMDSQHPEFGEDHDHDDG
jgi:hypothetical protein